MDNVGEDFLFEMKQLSLKLKERDGEYIDAASLCMADGVDICIGLYEELISTHRLKLLPETPTEDMWCGTARHLVKYMQMKDRYCPASLQKHFDRFVGDIPDWLNEEVNDWTSEHAFATADLGVFIYKAMYHEYKE